MKKMWCFILLSFALIFSVNSHAFDKVFIQGYYGRVADMSLQNFFESPGRITDFKDANMASFGCGGENLFWNDRFTLGGELNGSYHWGYKSQEFGEISAAFFLRWYKFPWQTKIFKSVSIGDGLSFVTDYPKYEIDFGGGKGENAMKEKWLNYLFIEVAFGVSDQFDFFLRLHHRCTAWGIVGSPDNGGVTFPSLGIRYTF
jgi:hypothetical protein